MNPKELFLPDGSGLGIEEIAIVEKKVIIQVSSTRTTAKCPHCSRESSRVNSRYPRKPADLPCAGYVVQLQMRVRSFFCDNEGCAHRTFAERFPEVVAPYARRTERLAAQQQQVAFAVGGEVGARLLKILGMPVSPDTLIRLVRRAPEPEVTTPRVLGVDDWAKKKGQSYGTILVNLEAHQVVDLLPERSAEALAQWLESHPGVEIISRDRGTEYIKGATDGAPEAMQVADRWHLLKNLREALERLLTEKPACLKAAATPPAAQEEPAHQPQQSQVLAIASESKKKPITAAEAQPMTQQERQKQARHARKQERYDLVHSLHAEGLSIREIGRRLHISYHTTSKYLRADSCPFYPEQVQRGKSKLDPYLDHLTARWQEGSHNASQLWRELQAQGFDGSRGLVAKWAAARRKKLPATAPAAQRQAAPARSPRSIPWRPARTAWLLFKPTADLDEEEEQALERIKQVDPSVAQAHELVHTFQQLIRNQQSDSLASWIQEAISSGIAALVSFANGIQQDLAAVRNALSSSWSNGQTEGQVNRLKFIKRQMYGRANFDLLRRRVLGFPAAPSPY